MSKCVHDFEVICMVAHDTWRLRCNDCTNEFDLTLKSPACCGGFFENGRFWHSEFCESLARESGAKPIGAHSDGLGGIRCAGTATSVDRDESGSAALVTNDPSERTSVAGGDSVP